MKIPFGKVQLAITSRTARISRHVDDCRRYLRNPRYSFLFNEPHAGWAADQLDAVALATMSTVNLTECLIRLRDRRRGDSDVLVGRLSAMNIEFVAPERRQADLAAAARLRYPLNFGDCFAYALAKTYGAPLLTLDGDFRATDVALVPPPAA